MRINVGCGATPTSGWVNFDNSLTIRFVKAPWLAEVLVRLGLMDEAQLNFLRIAAREKIQWADATRLPLPPHCAEVVYSSHMLEHLDRHTAAAFIGEVHRILRPDGIIRISVPDLRQFVERYIEHGDADALVGATLLAMPPLRTFSAKLKFVTVGARHHLWMYDGKSLSRLLESIGFRDPQIMPAGSTRIQQPGTLDLCERASESVYVEAIKSAT